MRWNTLRQYPFTADYYKTQNTAPPGSLPVWEDTLIRTINAQVANDSIVYGRMLIFTDVELSIGYIVKNIRDTNGVPLGSNVENTLGVFQAEWRVSHCDPVVNVFGYLEGYKADLQQTNGMRAA